VGAVKIVKQLITHKANINETTKDGDTPLILSCAGGHFSIVDLLIVNGASTNVSNNDGITPYKAALQGANQNIIDLLREKTDGTTEKEENETNAPKFFTSGIWEGYWLQGGAKGDMKIKLEIQQAVITGFGCDDVGPFSWQGACNENARTMKMVKQYHGQHKVVYDGKRKGKVVIGIWTITEDNSGKFLLKRVALEGEQEIQDDEQDDDPAINEIEDDEGSDEDDEGSDEDDSGEDNQDG